MASLFLKQHVNLIVTPLSHLSCSSKLVFVFRVGSWFLGDSVHQTITSHLANDIISKANKRATLLIALEEAIWQQGTKVKVHDRVWTTARGASSINYEPQILLGMNKHIVLWYEVCKSTWRWPLHQSILQWGVANSSLTLNLQIITAAGISSLPELTHNVSNQTILFHLATLLKSNIWATWKFQEGANTVLRFRHTELPSLLSSPLIQRLLCRQQQFHCQVPQATIDVGMIFWLDGVGGHNIP